MVVLVILAAVVITNVTPILIISALTKSLGVGVPKIQFGVWSPKLEFKFGTSSLIVTPWQLSSSCTVKDRANLDIYSNVPGTLFGDLHPLLRFLIAISGSIVLLASTVPVLGTQAFLSLLDGFSQVIEGALAPFSYAQELLAGFAQTARLQPITAGAIAITKLLAFSLLPLPPNNGGNALLQLIQWRRAEPPQWAGVVQHMGIFAILAIALSWACAAIAFAIHGGATQ